MKAKEKDEWEITNADIFRYYIGWEDTDKELVENIKKGNEEKFHDYLKSMRIARNFKTNSYKNVFKFTREYVSKNTAKFDVKDFSDSLYKKHFLAGDNKNAIVAASKILWIYNLKETIIQDSRAKKALKKLTGKKIGKYQDYCEAWEAQYLLFKKNYDEKIKATEIDKLDNVFKEEWFIRRTFDNYLWSRGKVKNKSNLEE